MAIAYIGMGANLPSPAGPPEVTLARAAERLREWGRVTARSRLYSTAPVGLANQPRFLNAVVAFETELEPRELLGRLLGLERDFGRDRAAAIANGPRSLDLDILLFGNVLLNEPDLTIPHPRYQERAFVLLPLHEIAPQAHDPRSGSDVAQCLRRLFPDPTGADPSVVPIESDVWRAGAGGDAAAGRDPVCPGARNPDH